MADSNEKEEGKEKQPEQKGAMPADYSPYPKDGVLFCKCCICKSDRPLKFSIETYTDNILICTACSKLFDKADYGAIKSKLQTIMAKEQKEFNCALCGGEDDPKHHFTTTFALPNSPTMLKSICSAECLQQLQATVNNEATAQKKCRKCFGEVANNRRCSHCKVAYYCDAECQRADWKEHKKICAKPRVKQPGATTS